MKIASPFIIVFSIVFTSCTQRVICPAYQSAFIHDDDVTVAKFSYFRPDSTPKIRETDKDRFLIVEPVAYRKRTRELETVEMKDIIPTPVDTATFDQDLLLAERDVVDSTQLSADAGELHPGLKGPFNNDQELYMYYLRDILLLPDARAAQKEEKIKNEVQLTKRERRRQKRAEEKEAKERKGPFSIFDKKDDEPADTPPAEEEEDNENAS